MAPDLVEFPIKHLAESNIESALQLCRLAGWNQLHGDWLRVIEHEPRGCFIAENAGRLAGTVSTTVFGEDLAWIGMMLVHPDFRRRGLATSLMKRAMEYLHSLGVRCIKLDATPDGAHVYEQLGFEAEWNFNRWSRSFPATANHFSPKSGRLCPHSLALDQRAFGSSREKLLHRLSQQSQLAESNEGFGMLRVGHLAAYLGPVVASTSDAATAITLDLLDRAVGEVFWDIPGPNTAGIALAKKLGFQPVRTLTRMRSGNEVQSPDLQMLYALADPSTG